MRSTIAIALFISLVAGGCKSSKNAQATTATKGSTAMLSDTSRPSQVVNLPVFIPVTQLQKQLYKLYFEPNYGKFYPCEGHSDCSDLYKDLYIENPVLKVNGEMISIKMHVAGNANALIFHPEVSGDITLTAKPAVRNDTLFFDDVTMEKSSQNFLMTVASSLFEKRIISKIQQNAWYSFRPTLDNYTKDFQKQLPFKWETSVLLINLKRIYLNRVTTISSPSEGILADFSAELTIEKPTFGQ